MMHTFYLLPLLTFLFSTVTCRNPTDQSQFTIYPPFTSATTNFDTFGSATLHSDTIVLTPHSPSHSIGAIWSKVANPHKYWEAEFSFRASGAERGGTGLAFWYSARRGLGGNVFGSVDAWDGLGLFFDANTGGKSMVRGHLNAGDVRYVSLEDPISYAFGSCQFVFRGVSTPIVVRVTNSQTSFKVTLDGQTCFETDQVILQPGNYFGVSAGTGDMPDHHQLFSFKVTPLEVTEPAQPKVQPENPVSTDKTPDDVKVKLDELTKQMKEWQDQSDIVLRRIEASTNAIARSIGILSGTVNQLQNDITKAGTSSGSIVDTLHKLSSELMRLETALKDHMSGHVDVLSESLVGRGGFWKGIWMVIGVQTAGWVIYEIYRGKKDTEKKLI